MGSDDDSDYEELVERGYELHPLVRFRRMRSTKRAELAYHYNPHVAKNKDTDMIPLWQAAKKTVDGGRVELLNVIKEKEAQNDAAEKKLIEKLKLVLADLDGQSKTFHQL